MSKPKPSDGERRGLFFGTIILLLLFIFTWGVWNAFAEGWIDRPFQFDELAQNLIFIPFILAIAIAAWQLVDKSRQEAERQVEQHRRHLRVVRELLQGLVKTMMLMADVRDHETWGHCVRVQRYGLRIGDEFQLSAAERRDLWWGSLLHDIGKIGIPDAILHKPGPLTPEERRKIEEHVIIGCQIVQQTPLNEWAYPIVRHHHERFDGTGYPDRLAGTEIPLVARIFSVVDAFDAMTSDRPYRRAMTIEEAREVIAAGSGAQFCPQVVEKFLRIPLAELEAIRVGEIDPVLEIEDIDLLGEEIEERLSQMYFRDHVTEVLNRNALEERRTQLRDSSGPALGTVVFVDLDNLKQVNDLYGHHMGDRVLGDVAHRLRQVGGQVYRYGGDEFILLFAPLQWSERTEAALEEALEGFRESWQHLSIDMRASYGIAQADEHTDSIDQLFALADERMYHAKYGPKRSQRIDVPTEHR